MTVLPIPEDMTDDADAVTLATELTIAWLSNPNTRITADDVPAFLTSMHTAVFGLGAAAAEPATEEAPQEHAPAVSVRKSLASKDHIVSMIEDKTCKTLHRHLVRDGLTPEQYRERYHLRPDYPDGRPRLPGEPSRQSHGDLNSAARPGRRSKMPPRARQRRSAKAASPPRPPLWGRVRKTG